MMQSSIFGDRLYYFKNNNFTNFSGSLASLLSDGDAINLCKEGITSFLTFRYPIGKYTMFDQYSKLPAGCKPLNNGIINYWYPSFPKRNISFNKAVKATEDLLLKSIKKLVDDKKVAVAISGGLDSSLVVAMLRSLYPRTPIYTYSVGFYGDNEFEYSRIVAKKFNTTHKEIILHKDDYIGEKSLLKPLLKFKAEPLHPNELALTYAERLAKEDGCELVMCGEGADDIFGGYGQNLRMYLNYKSNIPFFHYFIDNYRYFSLEDRTVIRDSFLMDDIELIDTVLSENELPADIRDYVLYFTQKVHTVGLITRGVNALRFNNLEPGFPYIDKELVEFVNSLPFSYKVHWKSEKDKKAAEGLYFREISEKFDIPKYILKKIAEKYLPHKIIYRPKYGFPIPFDKWFHELKEWPLNQKVFNTTDISNFNGWKKFMLINLNTFIEVFCP